MATGSARSKAAILTASLIVFTGAAPAMAQDEGSWLEDNAWAAVLILVAAVAVKYLYERRRSSALQAAANALGLSFEKKSDIDVKAEFAPFHLFSEGGLKVVTNRIWGQLDGADVMVFGYAYFVSRVRVAQTVACFRSDQLTLPAFELRPKTLRHKIGSALGFHDIEFPDAPEFPKHYLLRGPDEVAVRAVFTSDLIRNFETRKRLCVEADGNTLICYRQDKRVKPADIAAFLNESREIYALLRR